MLEASTCTAKNRDAGFALIVTLLITAAIAIVVLGTSFTALIDRQTSGQQESSSAAYYIAQAGLNKYKTLIFRQLARQYAETEQGWCESPLSVGITDPDGVVILQPGQTSPPEAIGMGTYEVTYDLNGLFIILTSVGRVGGDRSVLQLVTTSGDGPASAWDNALLASGATGTQKNNGNVSVYGSIHIVGDYEAYDSDLSVSGTVGIFNTYFGDGTANSDIRDEVSLVLGDAEDIDLCARVKIKTGSMYLQGGSVNIGSAADPIYSIHMQDGNVYGAKKQNATDRDIIHDHHDDNRINLIHPEGEGLISPYEAWDIPFPELADDYPADVQDALTLSLDTCPGLPIATEVDEDGLEREVLHLPPPDGGTFSCGAEEGHLFEWTSDGVLRVNGTLNLGDLDVSIDSNIVYDGIARLRQGVNKEDTSRMFRFGGSVMPATPTYLDTDGLALETSGSIDYDVNASSPVVAMLMYAQEQAIFSKQIIVIGSVIADEYSVEQNVPNIAYHPNVREFAETLGLVGTCQEGECNPGALADISIERRDTAAID